MREVELAASLRHPNIVQVYESGVHQDLFYYAMELVEGQSLDQFVSERGSNEREILALMVTTCAAVGYAHRRGVIHRDLKPSNILVTADGQPRVLDFGLAKLSDEKSEHPSASINGDIAGTPAFMSPEQAAGRAQEVGTVSDVYALGKIAFLLLTGQPAHALEGSKIEIMRRVADEPIRSPMRDGKPLGRELEAVLRKALDQDPLKRYSSAIDLGADLERYLAGDPVNAKPPSLVYLARTRLKKHRWAVVIGGAFAALVIALCVFSYVRIEIERSLALREAAKAQAVSAFFQETLRSVDPKNARGHEPTVREFIDRVDGQLSSQFAGEPDVEAMLRNTLGMTYFSLGRYAQAEKELSAALDLSRHTKGSENIETVSAMNDLAACERELANYAVAEALARQALVLAQKSSEGSAGSQAQRAMTVLAYALSDLKQHAEATGFAREVLSIRQQLYGPNHHDTISSWKVLAIVLRSAGKLNEAETAARMVFNWASSTLGNEDPETLNAAHVLASNLALEGDKVAAEQMLSETIQIGRRVLGESHPDVLVWSNDLASVHWAQGRLAEATDEFRRTWKESVVVNLADHPYTLTVLSNLGSILVEQGNYLEAERDLREVLERREKTMGPTAEDSLRADDALAAVLCRLDRRQEAESLYRFVWTTRRNSKGDGDPETLVSGCRLATVLFDENKLPDAEAIFRVVLENRRRLRPMDPVTASTAHDLALVLAREDRYAEAAKILRQTLAEERQSLGAENRTTLKTEYDCAIVLQAAGDTDAAKSLMGDVFDIGNRVFGASDPITTAAKAAMDDLQPATAPATQAIRK